MQCGPDHPGLHPCSRQQGQALGLSKSWRPLVPGSREVKMTGSHLLGEAQGRCRLLTAFIFCLQENIWNKSNANMCTGTYISPQLQHGTYVLLGIKCSLLCLPPASLLQSTPSTLHTHGQRGGLPDPGATRTAEGNTQAGRAGTLQPFDLCFYQGSQSNEEHSRAMRPGPGNGNTQCDSSRGQQHGAAGDVCV